MVGAEAALLTWIMLDCVVNQLPSTPWKITFVTSICWNFTSNLFTTIYLIHLDPCIASTLHFHSHCMYVYVCVYGAPLHVGLLSPSHTSGAGSGTEHPEGPNFPRLPNPSLLCLFLRLLAIQEYASQVLGNLHAALLPSSTYSLIPRLTLSFLYTHSHFRFSSFSFSLSFTFSLHLSVPHFLSTYPPCSSPLWPLAATVNPLHEVLSVCSSVPYVWWHPLDTLARSLTAWFGPSVSEWKACIRKVVNLYITAILRGFYMFILTWVKFQIVGDCVKRYPLILWETYGKLLCMWFFQQMK